MIKTRLEINYEKVNKNIANLIKDKKPCLMVKANNYGMGTCNVKKLIDMGYDYYGVSTIEEALELRKIDQNISILVVTPIFIEEFETARNNNIIHTIISVDSLKKVQENDRIHLKFDTGMGRVGFQIQEIEEVLRVILEKKKKIEGIFSHLACASEEKTTRMQINKFKKIVDKFNENKISVNYIHLQNTMGCLLYELDFVNMVRPGLGIWGYVANKNELKFANKLEPTVTLYAATIHSKNYDGYIGYDHIQRVSGLVETLRIGYQDGIERRLTGFKFKNGAKVIGKVCMCQMMLLVFEEQKEYEIFGEKECIYDLCEYCNITVYEQLSKLSNRIERE